MTSNKTSLQLVGERIDKLMATIDWSDPYSYRRVATALMHNLVCAEGYAKQVGLAELAALKSITPRLVTPQVESKLTRIFKQYKEDSSQEFLSLELETYFNSKYGLGVNQAQFDIAMQKDLGEIDQLVEALNINLAETSLINEITIIKEWRSRNGRTD